jgi:hypothetical protein
MRLRSVTLQVRVLPRVREENMNWSLARKRILRDAQDAQARCEKCRVPVDPCVIPGCSCLRCRPEEEEMSIIRGVITCPQCHTENGNWRRRCRKCGKELKSSALPANQPKNGW